MSNRPPGPPPPPPPGFGPPPPQYYSPGMSQPSPQAPPPPPPPGAPQPKQNDALLVNATISQDRTLGATAIEESNLRSLSKQLLNLSLKSDENKIIRDQYGNILPRPIDQRLPGPGIAPPPPPPIAPGGPPGPPPPQSWNDRNRKKRPRRRRGRYSSGSSASSSRSSSPPSPRGHGSHSPINPRRRLRADLEDEARLGTVPHISIEAVDDGTLESVTLADPAVIMKKAALSSRLSRQLSQKEQDILQQLELDPDAQQTDSSASSNDSDYSDSDSDASEASGEDSEGITRPAVHTPLPEAETDEITATSITNLWNDAKQYRILCSIGCSSRRPTEHHFSLFYEDVPFKSKESEIVSRHLSGHIPIPSPKDYLKSIEGQCSFLVFRLYSCFKSGQDAPRQRPTVFPKASPMSSKNEYLEYIAIHSSRLANAIREVSTCNPDDCTIPSWLDDGFEGNIVMGAPYRWIFHHKSALLEYSKKAKPAVQRKIVSLLNYVEATVGAKHKRAEEYFSHGTTDTASSLFLYKPEEPLLYLDKGIYTAHILATWPGNDSYAQMNCWCWGYDGMTFTRRKNLVRSPILPVGKNKVEPISSLMLYPLKYATDKIRADLQERGKRFWTFRYQTYICYIGWDVLKEENHMATRCVVDYQTYRRFHPEAEVFRHNVGMLPPPYFGSKAGPRTAILEPSMTPTEVDYYIMPPNVHGFVLQEKKWVNLWVSNVHEIVWNKDAFQRLVMPPKTKDLIKALVLVRASKHGKKEVPIIAAKREDIIASKGNGLVVLLHGGPGTGKTLTAESVAELAEMPLYRVTCGDIGTNAEAVEKYLQTILYLGKTWNCVLLLDEADVFLEERTLSDLQRNSLVSVFLRILEYYEGILILTSNRVGTFDEAFRSRMQLALHYPNLTPASRKKIWQNFFDMLQEDEEDVDVDEIKLHIDELADKEMNGREIRNALTTAKQLALYKKETLTWDHVEHTVKIAGDFNKYLKNVHGHTDEQRAREDGIR